MKPRGRLATLRAVHARRRLVHHNLVKDECPRGHPYDDANTYRDPSGARRCRACNLARYHRRARQRRRKVAA